MQPPTQYAVQRKHQRYVFSESLTVIRKLTANDVRRDPGICMEIGEGGLSAIVTEPLKVGDKVELKFDLTPGQSITVHGVVRNHCHFRHGFEFISLNEEMRERIRSACSSLKPYEGGWY